MEEPLGGVPPSPRFGHSCVLVPPYIDDSSLLGVDDAQATVSGTSCLKVSGLLVFGGWDGRKTLQVNAYTCDLDLHLL